MSHYFTNDNHDHDYRYIRYAIHNEIFTIKSDTGVFSRNEVDYGTTVLLKAILEKSASPSRTIDMGTGYGVIGIVLGRLLKTSVTAVDVNTNALALAEENAQANDVPMEVVERAYYDTSTVIADMYVTNPPFRAGKDVVMTIINDAYERLIGDGGFYMVVQKKQGMSSYKNAIAERFQNVAILKKDKGYYVLHAIKK